MKTVILDFDVEGYHSYPNAPKEVEFLSYPHRHIFQIRAGYRVTDSNREREIFIEQDNVKNYLGEVFGVPCQFENMSCEMIAEIFYNLDRGSETKYMSLLEKVVPEEAQKIKDLMFTFEDLVRLDTRSVQTLLGFIDKSELSVALKGASEDVKSVFFNNMSQRAARIIQEEVEALGPVRVKDVDDAQSKIVKIVKDLVEKL